MAARPKPHHRAVDAEPVLGDEFSRQQEVERESNDKLRRVAMLAFDRRCIRPRCGDRKAFRPFVDRVPDKIVPDKLTGFLPDGLSLLYGLPLLSLKLDEQKTATRPAREYRTGRTGEDRILMESLTEWNCHRSGVARRIIFGPLRSLAVEPAQGWRITIGSL
ncbi:MAG: hypothetical protein JNL58_29110 [Planctomyces sp.]|nr:hypothetical protein [Planctomyces sp.]